MNARINTKRKVELKFKKYREKRERERRKRRAAEVDVLD